MNQLRATRYEFLDLLRGIAVLLMIEGHAMRALLDWNIRATFAYDIHELFHGLPAPIFIFAAGAALAITRKVVAAEAGVHRSARKNWRRELRLLNVLIIAYALQLSDFSFFRTFFSMTPDKLQTLLNFNVLQCIVVSVLLVRAISALHWSENALARLLWGATIAVGVLTPPIWSAGPHLPLWLGSIVSRHYASYFPLFPYVGFALGGAAWGLAYKRAVQQEKESPFLHQTIVISGLVFAACTALAAVPWPEMYSDFWWSSPWYLWLRIAVLVMLCAFLRRWKLGSRGNPGWLQSLLALLGRQSFYAYVGHLIVLYGSSYNYNWNMLRQLGNDLDFWPAVGATSALAAVMIASIIAWDWAKRVHPIWANRAKWGLASYLTVVFLIS
jgi:uncharacterized membrane protein